MKTLEMIGIGSAALLFSVGCAHAPAPAEATAGAAGGDDPAVVELREHHRHHHNGGITQFIAMSLDTLGADDAKRAQIEKIQADLRQCMAPAHEIDKALLTTFADGIAAGQIDQAKVDASIAQLDTASTAVHDCSATALNSLHALLSPGERQALVDKVEAHWQVWRESNHEAHPGGVEKGGRLKDLTEELNLTPEQVEKMSAALHAAHESHPLTFDPAKAEEHVQAFATAFAADSFDAKTVTHNTNALVATHGARRMAFFYETITPLLTPDQRATLADHLRQHSTHQPAVSSS
jgi:Spy/CpxP family protein refolding chaperone